ncbi:hypothetical protein PDL71_09325 [Lacibacter sp. MH-610]|uniref:hypothetical protein n=1 Tax=Lacibacter sp. MH-610 TaxID=3020883 RepID=UPI003891D48E
MRKFIIILISLFPFVAAAQSVAINTDGSNPDNSSILDIKSSSKGLLIPRLTTLQRTSIAGPAIGLTVFDINTYSYWVYRGDVNGGWQELLTGLNKHWDINGTNIFNTNTGNVGIGTNNPQYKLSINAVNPRIDLLNNGTSTGFMSVNGSDLRLGTQSGNSTGSIVFSTFGADRVFITKSGLVGIKTSTPTEDLTLDGFYPTFQIQHDGTRIGFVSAQSNTTNFRIGTNSTNTTGKLLLQTKLIDRIAIDEDGLVGIGTSNPTSILSINSTNPIVQLKNDGVDKGFIQLVNDDIKIGTNLANTTGQFIVRTKGVDRFIIDENGNASFGNNSSGGILSMNGPFSSGLTLSSGNLVQGFVRATPDGLDIYRTNPGVVRIRSNGDGIWFMPNGQISAGGGGKTATGYVFSIEGKAIATEFRVLAVAAWPDYVFQKDYKLKSLQEVKNYIAVHKHLPGIPSAAAIEKSGVDLGDMTKRLMEKVEELTLYIIQLQEEVDALKKKQK